MKVKRTVFATLALTAGLLAAQTAVACPAPDATQVAGAVQSMFDAAARGDRGVATAQFAPSAYLFDNGARFDVDGVLNLIGDRQKAGYVYAWKVTEPDVHFACDTAWIAYVNRGAMTKDGQTTPVVWLESGALRWEGGRWRIQFLHSTRVASPQPPHAMALPPQ